jgi:hypothetical protein
MTVKQRRIIIRSALAVLWIGLLCLIFVLDRGHTVFVDNKSAPEGSGESYEAVGLMKVSIDGGKAQEFFQGDRDRFAVTGSKHRIRVEFTDGRPPLEKEFHLPLGTDLFLLSVPKMIAAIEPFVEPFHMAIATSRTADEAPPADMANPTAPEGTSPQGASPGTEALAPITP